MLYLRVHDYYGNDDDDDNDDNNNNNNNNNTLLSENVEWEIQRYVLRLQRTRTLITFFIKAFTGYPGSV